RWRSGNDHCLGDELRRSAVGVEISKHPIHSGLGESQLVDKVTVRLKCGMVVHEELQILADHEHVEELFVNRLKIRDGTVLPWVPHHESQSSLLPHRQLTRGDRELQGILDGI